MWVEELRRISLRVLVERDVWVLLLPGGIREVEVERMTENDVEARIRRVAVFFFLSIKLTQRGVRKWRREKKCLKK